MPTRFIKESCRSSKNLDRVTDFEERLFWRLITTADDFGRFLADPDLVRSACFPRRDRLPLPKIIDALRGLQHHALITLYSVKDRQYGQFCTFEEHQGKPRSRKSKYPAMLDAFVHADARTCMQMHADVPGHPDTDTDTNTNPSSLNGIGESERKGIGRACSLPEDFIPNDRAKELAKGQGQNVLALCAAFKDHHTAKGTLFKDWQAAFRTWLRNDLKFKEARR